MQTRTGLAGLLLCLPLTACQYHTVKTDHESEGDTASNKPMTSTLVPNASKALPKASKPLTPRISPKSATNALSHPNIRIIRMKNPNQPFEMAAKVQWNPHYKRWDKVLVLYNGHVKPPAKHPVWAYLKRLRLPTRQARHNGENLHYKAFYLQAYCPERNALSEYKPMFINFNQHSVGDYSEYAFRNDWFCPQWQMGRQQVKIQQGGRTPHGK
ncbi:MAG TPA: hypothetical protein ENK78_03480, partial [Thiothrix sp.]|nr:hypothetical protein [Thiothrix sp.]